MRGKVDLVRVDFVSDEDVEIGEFIAVQSDAKEESKPKERRDFGEPS